MSDPFSNSAKTTKIISAQSEPDYERWQAPDVQTIEQQKQERAGVLTARQLEELQKQAYDEGFSLGKEEGIRAGLTQGQEEGHQQGLLNAQEEVTKIIARFGQIIKFLAQPISETNHNVEDELLQLAMAIAKQIIRREISTDPRQIIAVIKEAISALPSNSKNIKIFLHPDDAQLAQEHLGSLLTESSDSSVPKNNDLWTIVEEPVLTRGGCQVKTEFSQVDASIETRTAEIAVAILGDERSETEQTSDSHSAISSEKKPVDV